MVIALFIDSGTLTADFTRWAQTSRHAAVGGWAVAIVAATCTHMFVPQLSAAVVAMLTGAGAYWTLAPSRAPNHANANLRSQQ